MSCAPSPASSARSTGLQSGTDAGMSSVLLTMIGSQCRNRNPPAAVFEYAAPRRNGRMMVLLLLLLRLTQASWWRAKGTRLEKQAYRGRTALYMMVNTRGSLLPPSWPLCLCVPFPHPPRVALREAARDNSVISLFCFGAKQLKYVNVCAELNQSHSRHAHFPLANSSPMRKHGLDRFWRIWPTLRTAAVSPPTSRCEGRLGKSAPWML